MFKRQGSLQTLALYFITREDTISSQTYKDAGVDITAGNALVEAIKPLVRATSRPGADGKLGGFGAIFDLAATGYDDPILVAATDGVGTKLQVAIATGRHRGVGVDLVAMCVNDLLVQGAEPLFFLDYYACGGLDAGVAKDVVAGIADGCHLAGCALIGGETAEMPGMYSGGDYDLAGFSVGAAERGEILTGEDVAEGDVVLGMASSGLHANGFSLVRKLVSENGLSYDDPAPFRPTETLGEALLAPTRIYVKSCLPLVRKGMIKAMAHITGGGFTENIPRVLPAGLGVAIDANAWPFGDVFAWLAATGPIAVEEIARTFNCGIGMVVMVAADHAAEVSQALSADGETVWTIGRVITCQEGAARVQLSGMEKSWQI